MSGPRTGSELLDAGEVHVWYALTERIAEPALLDSYRELLSEEERERHRRFHFARDRHLYLVSRALLRTTLSRYVDVRPGAWSFATGSHGRPEIAGPTVLAPPLRFNLSHTPGLACCAVALGRDVGVDAESVDRPGDTDGIAERFFSPAEARSLRELPPEARRRRFYDYWTLKESYIKARGLGLSLPLQQLTFHLDGDGPPRVAFGPEIADDPSCWQFARFAPTERHVMALALRQGAPAGRIRVTPVVPRPQPATGER